MAVDYQYRIVRDGLVLCLDAGNIKSYPGTGTTWFDRSGNGYNGTLVGGPTYSSSNGGSIVFDGVDDNITTNFDLDFTENNFTLCSWVNPNFISAIYGRPIMTMNTTGACELYDFTLEFGRVSGKFSLGVGGSNGTYLYTQNTYSQDSWYHICATRIKNGANNWTYIIYVNGSFSVTLTGNFNGGDGGKLTIGKFSGCSAVDEWSGKIAAVQIYNRTLAPEEILQNFNATRGRFGI
jgi:hypothetical protein